MARRNANYFRYGSPQEGILARIQGGAQWVVDQLKIGAASGREQAAYHGERGADAVKEGATAATNRAQEAAQKAGDAVKEEL